MLVLALPDLVLESILERGSLHLHFVKCHSMKEKWGRVVGSVAYREWKWHVASKRNVGSVFLDMYLALESNRHPPHGRRVTTIEHGVPWERLKAPPIDTPPHDLHIFDCVGDLLPGDHIEIKWRRNKYLPYGWFLYSLCS
ncbi:F-box protein At2g26850-like [Lotus japonicus]|uniref:F-box protein At2g26850-like n=1 Tax=Lotus japonicus TaxID=34305 RepID=UPI002584C3E8|nr:F-box protein At2g26850-like [Lotus japonicus]